METANDKRLFWACFIALIATAFGFIIRVLIIDQLGDEFNLDQTQKGEILGVGLWPFAISIVIVSMFIDRIGYGTAMILAFVCHVLSGILTIFATGYWSLYIATFVVALGNGTVEAVINPVVATMFPKEKTKWLNILHAGWPGGLVLGGLLTLAMGEEVNWQYKVALIFIPVAIYAVMMIGCKFPVHERVAAGVSYRDMLREVGVVGALIVVALMVSEVGRVFAWSLPIKLAVGGILVFGYGAYVQALGRPFFLLLLLIMIPLASTELGTDSWITPLMNSQMAALGLQAGWVLVYTSAIMAVLRFFAGPIVHKLSPLGLLALSSLLAAVGLAFLSQAAGFAILIAATLYGVGKTFFWPTMLGVVAEQFPKGGAMTLNTIAAVGMLSVGVIGNPLFGYWQDTAVADRLQAEAPTVAEEVLEERVSVFGTYTSVSQERLNQLSTEDQEIVTQIQDSEKQPTLLKIAILPCIMLVCYLALMVYFRSKGGYAAVDISEHVSEA